MKVRQAKKLINNGAVILVNGEKVFAAKVAGKVVHFAGCTASILDVSVGVGFDANCREGNSYTFAAIN